ncbi:MAG: lactate utilization protein [Bacteroidetes bacterium]|nr:lactate utilization protein [Bacteroidota bacterium]MBS1630073.1 lactate utilization protein [Bacteroidota bacterium]
MNSLTTSKARENILRKLRSGLEQAHLPIPFPEAELAPISQAFAGIEDSLEEHFAKEFIQLGGKFIFCSNENELLQNLTALCDAESWKQVLCPEPELLQLFHSARLDMIEAVRPGITEAEACITTCEAMVARTGSVLLSSRQPMGRIASVFYPVHIIIAYARQIVPDFPDGLNLLRQRYGKELPSMINLNTGPSRTADIEKTLVVGVHGPKEVYCFYVNQ